MRERKREWERKNFDIVVTIKFKTLPPSKILTIELIMGMTHN